MRPRYSGLLTSRQLVMNILLQTQFTFLPFRFTIRDRAVNIEVATIQALLLASNLHNLRPWHL